MTDREARLTALARQTFGLELDTGATRRMLRHAALVDQWSKRMNLVSASGLEEILERHVLDSLSVASLAVSGSRLLDVGSGAGFPGLAVAIARPDVDCVLLEKRRKRVSFLRHALRETGTTNALVMEGDGTDPSALGRIDSLVGRGVAPESLVELARRLLVPDGHLILMRKQQSENTVPGFLEMGRVTYRLPTGDRHETVAFVRAAR